MKLGKAGKIGISWGVLTVGSIFAFYLSRTSVVNQRREHMKIRERINESNKGEYDPSSRKYAN